MGSHWISGQEVESKLGDVREAFLEIHDRILGHALHILPALLRRDLGYGFSTGRAETLDDDVELLHGRGTREEDTTAEHLSQDTPNRPDIQ